MARFSRVRKFYGNRAAYYTKARGYASKAYAKSGLNLNTTFLAGVGAALVVPDNEMLTVGTLIGATMPIKGMGQVKGFSQGYVFGQVVQKYVLPKLGINFGNVMGGNASYGNVI